MGCKTCKQNVELLKAIKDEEQWLYENEVRNICPECADNMIKNNIKKIRKKVLTEKFRQEGIMKFYEVVYMGPEGSTFNIAGHVLEPKSPKYWTKEELPLQLKDLKKQPVEVNLVEFDERPSEKKKEAEMRSLTGVKWMGASPIRANEFGRFKRDEVVYVEIEVANKLLEKPGFKKA